jgi:hypothetical protein
MICELAGLGLRANTELENLEYTVNPTATERTTIIATASFAPDWRARFAKDAPC